MTAHEPQVPGEPVLADVQMHLHPVNDPAVGTVVGNERCTKGRKSAGFVRHVVIDIAGSRLAGAFRPGQAFGVLAPGLDAKGRPHAVRLYSTSSPASGEDGSGTRIATTVKRLIDENHESGKLFLGVTSNYLCDAAIGDQVRLTGPAGKRFVLPADPSLHDYVFVATGTGIAPFRGMLMDLFGRPNLSKGISRAALIMGSPYETDLLYDKQLRDLQTVCPRFRYFTALSRQAQPLAGDSRTLYAHDRLAASPEIAELLQGPRTLLYVCGVAGMELGILQALPSVLTPAAVGQYLRTDPEVSADPASWTRRMIHKQVRPTRRVFLEVY